MTELDGLLQRNKHGVDSHLDQSPRGHESRSSRFSNFWLLYIAQLLCSRDLEDGNAAETGRWTCSWQTKAAASPVVLRVVPLYRIRISMEPAAVGCFVRDWFQWFQQLQCLQYLQLVRRDESTESGEAGWASPGEAQPSFGTPGILEVCDPFQRRLLGCHVHLHQSRN